MAHVEDISLALGMDCDVIRIPMTEDGVHFCEQARNRYTRLEVLLRTCTSRFIINTSVQC